MALLAYPAINGYHSSARYQWEKNDVPVMGENTPLFYCVEVGVFKCCVSTKEQALDQEFIVSGRYYYRLVLYTKLIFQHILQNMMV